MRRSYPSRERWDRECPTAPDQLEHRVGRGDRTNRSGRGFGGLSGGLNVPARLRGERAHDDVGERGLRGCPIVLIAVDQHRCERLVSREMTNLVEADAGPQWPLTHARTVRAAPDPPKEES